MIFALALCLLSAFSLSYRKGETFSYVYDSEVATQAFQADGTHQETMTKFSCVATFKILSVSGSSAYLQMNLKNVRTEAAVNDEAEEGQFDEDSEEAMSLPIYFTQLADGSIDEVSSSEEDDEETVSVKTGVLFALRSTIGTQSSQDFEQVEVNDPIGTHYEFFQTHRSGDRIIVNSHYGTEDLVQLDDDTNPEDLRIDSTSQREFVNGKLVASTSSMSVFLNPENEELIDPEFRMSNEESDENILQLMTAGTYTLSDYAQGNDEEVEFPFATIAEAISNRPGYRTRRFRPRPVPPREDTEMVPDMLFGASACPSGIDVCKSYAKSWSVGNSNAGLSFSVSVAAGIKKGCAASARSYIAQANAHLNVLILSRSFNAADANAVYGQVNGKAQSNAITLKVFGIQLYHKSLGSLDCVSHSSSLFSTTKEFKFSYKVVVYVVPITFSAGVRLGFSVSLVWTVCPAGIKASVAIVPKATAALIGGASASVAVARAGVELSGTITDSLNPTAYIDGSACKVGFRVTNTLSPINVKLVGWWQVRNVNGAKITWGTKNTKTFWSHSWGGASTKLFDVSYGAK